MSERTRSEILSDLEKLRRTQYDLEDRLRRLLTAMAICHEVAADLHGRLDVADGLPDGHRAAAAAAAAAADTYRQFLSRVRESSVSQTSISRS